MNPSRSRERQRVVPPSPPSPVGQALRLPSVALSLALSATLALASSLLAADAPRLPAWREKMQPLIPPGYVVRHTATPPTIDGQLDDPAWADAPWTTDFLDIEGPAKPPPLLRTRAKILWDDEFLYLAAELAEPHLWAKLTAHDSRVFQDPAFEVFLDPDGDTHNYAELQLNALNTTWDLLLPKPYADGGQARSDWEISGLKTAVHLRGTLNDPRDTDTGWTLEIALPWAALSAQARHAGPPTEGEQWRANFSRVAWPTTTHDGTYQKIPLTPEAYWVWSPQGVVDLHRPEMWGTLQFTRRPASDAVEIVPLAGQPARDLALDFYYAQRDFFRTHQRWATTLTELAWTPPRGPLSESLPPIFTPTADGYTFTVPFLDAADSHRRTWTIHQDRRLTLDMLH